VIDRCDGTIIEPTGVPVPGGDSHEIGRRRSRLSLGFVVYTVGGPVAARSVTLFVVGPSALGELSLALPPTPPAQVGGVARVR